MAENVRKLMNADIGLSFTGVAGPDSLEGKEPGSVYIGISLKISQSKLDSSYYQEIAKQCEHEQ